MDLVLDLCMESYFILYVILKYIYGLYFYDIESLHDAHVFCRIIFSRNKADLPQFAVCDQTKVGIN